MLFYENQLFHIYNQGNNKRQVFFTDSNYEFFVWKMRGYLLPFGSFIAWTLMPNHFHWQFFVKRIQVSNEELREHIDKTEYQRRLKVYGLKARSVNRNHTRISKPNEWVNLNKAIGNLQVSYARALNKEKGWSGSIFRKDCKAKDGWIDEFVTLEKNGKHNCRFSQRTDYAYHCFNYIHDNPLKAKLVSKRETYYWSSAMDYAGLRNGTLCDLEMGRNLVNFM